MSSPALFLSLAEIPLSWMSLYPPLAELDEKASSTFDFLYC
jgi:hypothetical protein